MSQRNPLDIVQRVLIVISFFSVFLAPLLVMGSLSKSVKWNFYNSGTDYGLPDVYNPKFKLYAYQNLWTFYDAWQGPKDTIHSQSYNEIIFDPWRPIVRRSVSAAVVLGVFALTAFIAFAVFRFVQFKGYLSKYALFRRLSVFLPYVFLVASTALSVPTGITLASAMGYYKNHYRSLLAPTFYDPTSFYPDEDNLSAGYILAGVACGLFFLSSGVNVAYLVIKVKEDDKIQNFIKRLFLRRVGSDDTSPLSNERHLQQRHVTVVELNEELNRNDTVR